ncbi:MAG: hypothetical protein CMO80_00305 [Verrucomicrobiales bacterium]|nr:hypothetical protein [Verrucomicrobiales bacterium]
MGDQSEVTQIVFAGEWTWWTCGGLGLALGLAAWLIYFNELRRRGGRFRHVLPTLRALAVFWLVMMLAGAVRNRRWSIGEVAQILLFVDGSASMGLTDERMPDSRKMLSAMQVGGLSANLFDADLQLARARFEAGRDTAARLRPDIAGLQFHQGVKAYADLAADVFDLLKKIDPSVWQQVSLQRTKFMEEVVNPAKLLSSRVVGGDPKVIHRELQTILNVAARWGEVLNAAWHQHVANEVGRSADALQRARADFEGQTRLQRIERYLMSGESALLQKLADRHRVELVLVDGQQARSMWTSSPEVLREDRALPESLGHSPTNMLTDISQPVRGRTLEIDENERVAVVILSDGHHNRGESPVGMARMFGQRGVPVYTVGLGPKQRPPDVAVLDVEAPEDITQEGRVTGEIVLKDDMEAGESFPLRIQYGGRQMWMTNLQTRAEGVRRIPFDFSVKALASQLTGVGGAQQFSSIPLMLDVLAGVLPGDLDQENNVSAFHVSVNSRRPKVLIVDGRPRWEFRYIRNLLERDQRWEVKSLKAGEGGSYRPWVRGTGPKQYPADKDQLERFDLIVFGDLPVGTFLHQELPWLVDYVKQRAGGIVFIDGKREGLAQFTDTPMGVLLPVTWQPGIPKLEVLPIKFDLVNNGTLRTPMGFSQDFTVSRSVWNSFPGPHWVQKVEAKPGAEVLATAQNGAVKVPAIVYQRIGAGKVLYLGFDESWRWRYNVGDRFHGQFWNQVADWIMEPPFQVQDAFVAVDSGDLKYDSGAKAKLRVRLRDEALKRNPNAEKVQVELYRQGQRVSTVELTRDEGGGGIYRGESSALVNGEYETRVKIDKIPDGLIQVKTGFLVGPQSRMELSQLHCNTELLTQVAEESGGKYLPEEELGRLVELLDSMSRGRVLEEQTPLWNSFWWFIPAILLLALEWVIRKRVGLI